MSIAISVIRKIGFPATDRQDGFAGRLGSLAILASGATGGRIASMALFRTEARRRHRLFAA